MYGAYLLGTRGVNALSLYGKMNMGKDFAEGKEKRRKSRKKEK